MEDVVLSVYLRSRCGLYRLFHDEDGEVNIVATVILVGIAVMLAGIFRKQITELVQTLLTNLTSEATQNGAPK